ncbi:DnaA ATPase domain-containing protein [Zavarzinella formosa]|uniref:DnaA ATPase domain-containing protein n=1 Tax=Zavarzinella formosa TaxID=360055 RepID=UPI00031032C5|nr:DnaA/Hda family protein [Zavarzinella formosa]
MPLSSLTDSIGLVDSQTEGSEVALAEAITRRISQPRYDLWFRGHTKFVFLGDRLVVGVPNLHFHDWLQKTFTDDIRVAASEVFGSPVAVQFAIDPDLFRALRQEQESTESAPVPAARTGTVKPSTRPVTPGPAVSPKQPPAAKVEERKPNAIEEKVAEFRKPKRRWKSLGDFVPGMSNRVAHSSAQAVVDEPGQGANPLVIYGPTGTGKTHLLEGVYLGLRKRYSDQKVVFIAAEDFMNRFLAAVHQNKQGSFRKQYRECFAFLIDDLSFLAGKKATQVEFLHTFDALISEGTQVVITCDCHPRLTEDLMPELADRLLGGAVWGVMPPDPETRLSLLRAKSATGTARIPDEVLKFLASNLRGNVRELEGAIHGLTHYARVTNKPVTRDLAREALGDLLRHAVKVVHLKDVDTTVCAVLKLEPRSLQSKSKAWAISHSRMIAIYLARKHTSASYGEVSIHFGNKTHSTAVAAEKKVRAWIEKNGSIKAGDHEWRVRELIDRIERELLGR